jgi:type I restriction enzyme, S subunit
VEQDPNDEPAAELLKWIHVEKASQGRGFNSEEPKSEMFESPFAIPTGWAWVTATEPARIVSDNGKKIQTEDVLESGSFPVVDQGKVFIRGFCNDLDKVIKVSKPIVVFGDHTRETKLIDFDFVVGADGVKLLEPIEIAPAYYFLALQWVPLDSRGYGRHFKLLRESLIPLPPLAEQHRVVAKVDELMALCDQLEAAKTEREQSRDRLVAACLHCLDSPTNTAEDNAPKTFRDHARFYFNYLPRLTTRPEHIKQLRQTILNLAVREKLVGQSRDDRPASELLRRIQVTKEQLVKEGELKKDKAIWDGLPKEPPNELPSNWTWTHLQSVFEISRGGSPRPAGDPRYFGGPIPWITVGEITKPMLSIKCGTEIQRIQIYRPKTALIVRLLRLKQSYRIPQNLPAQNDVPFEPRLLITNG